MAGGGVALTTGLLAPARCDKSAKRSEWHRLQCWLTPTVCRDWTVTDTTLPLISVKHCTHSLTQVHFLCATFQNQSTVPGAQGAAVKVHMAPSIVHFLYCIHSVSFVQCRTKSSRGTLYCVCTMIYSKYWLYENLNIIVPVQVVTQLLWIFKGSFPLELNDKLNLDIFEN